MDKVESKKSTHNGTPVKPKKPLPIKEEPAKVPTPCAVLTEEGVREIAREEILKREMEKVELVQKIDALAQNMTSKQKLVED